MAYSGSNPATLLLQIGIPTAQNNGKASNLYLYQSSHFSSDITAANFFTGCAFGSASTNAIGMNVGDIVINCTTAGFVSMHAVTSISTSTSASNTGMGCNLSPLHATVSAATS